MNMSRRLLSWYIVGAFVCVLAFAVGGVWFTHASVNAQPYGITLPANVLSVNILGTGGVSSSTVSNGQIAVINTATPQFTGQLAPGTTSVRLTLVNKQQVTSSTAVTDLADLTTVSIVGDPTRITVPVDPTTGNFNAQVSHPLDQGTYVLYINDALVDEFIIAL
ncbi:MAG: hypothetical protein ACYDAR_08730 [Thermomicrobiales bacterium]